MTLESKLAMLHRYGYEAFKTRGGQLMVVEDISLTKPDYGPTGYAPNGFAHEKLIDVTDWSREAFMDYVGVWCDRSDGQ